MYFMSRMSHRSRKIYGGCFYTPYIDVLFPLIQICDISLLLHISNKHTNNKDLFRSPKVSLLIPTDECFINVLPIQEQKSKLGPLSPEEL